MKETHSQEVRTFGLRQSRYIGILEFRLIFCESAWEATGEFSQECVSSRSTGCSMRN